MTSNDKLYGELSKAAQLVDKAERGVGIAAIIAEALRSIGQDPVLVGGAAVEYYTEGGYSTTDIDMLAEGGPDLVRVMESLGFTKLGKDFVQDELRIYVEFPGRCLQANEHANKIKVGSRTLKIISMEDLVVDRLCSFKFWQSAIDGLNAIKLLELGVDDEARLNRRAGEQEVQDALSRVREVREEVIRKKLNPEQANALLIKKMRSLKA